MVECGTDYRLVRSGPVPLAVVVVVVFQSRRDARPSSAGSEWKVPHRNRIDGKLVTFSGIVVYLNLIGSGWLVDGGKS